MIDARQLLLCAKISSLIKLLIENLKLHLIKRKESRCTVQPDT
jgi:hypothetical protein